MIQTDDRIVTSLICELQSLNSKSEFGLEWRRVRRAYFSVTEIVIRHNRPSSRKISHNCPDRSRQNPRNGDQS